jgi:hypothetical protein
VDDPDSNDDSDDEILPDKQDFVNMIRRVALKEEPKPVKGDNLDPMAEMFPGSSKKDKNKRPGLPLSDHQKGILRKVLHAEEPNKLKNINKQVKVGIPFEEDVFQDFLRTPVLNPAAEDYATYAVRSQSKRGSSSGARSSSKSVFKDSFSKGVEKDLVDFDKSARNGIRLAAYEQWLITTLKLLLCSELGPDHELTQKGGDLFRVFDELFKCSDRQLETSAGAAAASTLARRRLFLRELPLREEPHTRALNLPLDHNGRHLFGTYLDDNDNVTGFDSIPPDFAQKMVAMREARAALKPQASYRGSRPAPQSDKPKQENKDQGRFKGQGQGKQPPTQNQTGGRQQQRTDSRRSWSPKGRATTTKRPHSDSYKSKGQDSKKPYSQGSGRQDAKKPPFRKGGGGGWRK